MVMCDNLQNSNVRHGLYSTFLHLGRNKSGQVGFSVNCRYTKTHNNSTIAELL